MALNLKIRGDIPDDVVELYLELIDGSLHLRAHAKKVAKDCTLVSIEPDGRVKRWKNVNPAFGFQLEDDGCVVLRRE